MAAAHADEKPWQLPSEFYLKLAFWDRVPAGDVEPHLAAQERAYGAYLRELEGIKARLAGHPDHPLALLAEVGRRHAEVELAWLAEVRHRLGRGHG